MPLVKIPPYAHITYQCSNSNREKNIKKIFLIVDFMSWQLTRRSDIHTKLSICLYLKAILWSYFFGHIEVKRIFFFLISLSSRKVCLLSPSTISHLTPFLLVFVLTLIASGCEMETKKFFISFFVVRTQKICSLFFIFDSTSNRSIQSLIRCSFHLFLFYVFFCNSVI